ncbi:MULTISPECIES: hypothetical protein [unclassified Janthinobacterium]|uniref:hypothetical protein n=1 Tax=unclassified Janthinobacterium TaxID=2610881 RepID=UPI000C687232|nr:MULTISPECIES: hypothetical protein [unclassified Janthinobacterium]MDN2676441.1 hypothetical protein [Janthinobacterium sp. SUN033]MDO8064747.1 hypothetical protein [Janthinobacterium sp. SUN206]MDO8071085.1 hypothetical protein [Janthinobacterium sp. SUN176]MED5612574.1 hypothetical protein [Janthinobacterium sp. P210005]PIF08091.1 hypothetical protein CLU94_0045 [Janthinobacterium sp. 13]
MKTWILAGTLGVCALLANAQTLPDSQTVVVPGGRLHTIELPAHKHFMSAESFAPFRGGYELSNGQVLYLRNAGSIGAMMYARIDNQEEHRIIATGSDSFVALDQQLAMRIDLRDDGSVGGEVLMRVPAEKLASGEIVPAHVQSMSLASR